MVWEKGWTLHLFRDLQVALPGLRAVRLVPAGSTVDNLSEIITTHTVGKPRPGLCAMYPTTGLIHCPMRMDMIAINNYFPAGEPQADHSNLAFEWQAVQAQWWDNLWSCAATQPCPLSTTSPISPCPLSIG